MGAGGTAAGHTLGTHVLALTLFALSTLAFKWRTASLYSGYFTLVTGGAVQVESSLPIGA
jgi:hypothetical protein